MSQAEEQCQRRPGLEKSMKSFRNSQQAEVFASGWWERRKASRPSRQQQGAMAGVNRDREGLDQA